MANRTSSSTIEIDIDPYHVEPEREHLQELDSATPLRLLVMGDFSGHATGKLIRLDRDNFEKVLRDFAPHVEIGQLSDTELVFRTLSDFEPDNIYKQCELFAPLREGNGPALYSEPVENEAPAPLKPSAEQLDQLTSPGGLLDAIIEKSAAPKAKQVDELQSMVERIVAPYAIAGESAQNRRAAAERAQRLSLLMAHILHDKQFQALEAGWRGLDLLVRGLDTDVQVQLYLLDISKEKLAAELTGTAAVLETDVYRTLTEDAPLRWGLLAANLSFDRDMISDVELLQRISGLAQALGSPFIGEWLTSQHENSKAQAAWQAFRKTAPAAYLGLALPRFLLRLPYGKETARVESFEFEEMTAEPEHNHYLWGNPAFACALVLGQLFEEQGSLMRVPGFLRLTGLPFAMRPCTEVLLSDNDCLALLEEGVLPLVAVKSSDSIVFPHMQSIADPPATLAGFHSANW
jgi:type VI secretion system protein ImpC